MQTAAKEQEKLLKQMAVRQVSTGKGSAFFNLLFPFSIFVAFSVFYIAPLTLRSMLETQSAWLDTYLFWSTPVSAIAACSLYGFLRCRRIKPMIEILRQKMKTGESIN